MGLTVKELLFIGNIFLDESGIENAPHDAEVLLGFEIGSDRQKIFMNQMRTINEAHCKNYIDLINRRAAGEPLQYITGESYFMGFRFSVNPTVLIPRPETEILADIAIAYLQARDGRDEAENVLDLCTGSGALAISIAISCPRVKVTASDISEQALLTAKKNAADHGVRERVTFVKSDLFDSFKHDESGNDNSNNKFDLIITNPPYIKTGELAGLQKEIKDHEPMSALDGGADGLDFYRRIAKDALLYLREGGCVMAEIGFDQAKDVSDIFLSAGFANCESFKDLAGLDRIVKAC